MPAAITTTVKVILSTHISAQMFLLMVHLYSKQLLNIKPQHNATHFVEYLSLQQTFVISVYVRSK